MDKNYYTRGEKEYLLKIARETIEQYLRNNETIEPQTKNQKLWEKVGVFVSLHLDRELRGCIGLIDPVESLILAVRDNVLLAARDPRFAPVERSELNELEIEISILTPPEKTSLTEITKGFGVVLQNGSNKATYLPQVWETISGREEFFNSLCQKAGLAGDCHQNPQTELFKYEAIVFREKTI